MWISRLMSWTAAKADEDEGEREERKKLCRV